MSLLYDLVGHPGLAPLVWWIIGFLMILQLIFIAGLIERYVRLRPRTREAKRAILLPITGNLYFNSSVLFVLLMLHLDLIGQAPFPWLFTAVAVVLMSSVIWGMATRGDHQRPD